MQFGIPGLGNTIPTPADFEGTGKADIAVYLPSMASFAIIPSNGQPARFAQFGIAGAGQSIPAPADYYGTGQADIAVYLAAQGAFAVQDPTGKTPGEVVPFGMPGSATRSPFRGTTTARARPSSPSTSPAWGRSSTTRRSATRT